jgi:hypothetical protein
MQILIGVYATIYIKGRTVSVINGTFEHRRYPFTIIKTKITKIIKKQIMV